MGGYSLFFGCAMIGYYGTAIGRLSYKGHKKNQLRREAEKEGYTTRRNK